MDKILHKIKKYIPVRLFKLLQPTYHFLMSWLSALVYRFPSEKIIVIGVTGTTGKTTSLYLVAKTLQEAGYKVGYTSTALFSDGEKEWLNDKKMTMVGRFFTQKILSKMVKNQCQYAIIETTSEGVVQYRHRFINYDILIFTGLYPEHIESHGSFERYKEAKGSLFAHLKNCKTKYADTGKKILASISSLRKIELNRVKKTIIVNGDDQYASYFLNFWAEEKIAYRKKGSKTKFKPDAKNIDNIVFENLSTINNVSFKIDQTEINLNLIGEYNIYNAMNAYCAGVNQGLTPNIIKKGLESVSGLPGRMEKIDEGQKFTVIVDYAFEPRAVEKLYESLQKIEHQKIIHVLGSTGGGRDESRRPVLGKLAGQKADYVIVTNEDPYDDDPQIIIDQVAIGAEKTGKKKGENLFVFIDRRDAIAKALNLANKGDVVLITGKGSEQAICVANSVKIPWDDRIVTREELKKIKK